MKKLVISVSIALILFSGGYFLLRENLVKLGGSRIRDVVGQGVEERYYQKADVMVFGLERFIAITEKKLDFLLGSVDLAGLLSKEGDKKAQLVLSDFVNADPYCKRIRIVNSGLEILYSTSQSDVRRSRLNRTVYGSLFKEQPKKSSRMIVDPVANRVVFYKTFTIGGGKYAVLFYHAQSVLDTVFSRVEGVDYKGFVITVDKIVLVNFPEIDASEQENLDKLVKVIRQNDSGALRILLRGLDKTVYYKKSQGQYTDWTVALTLDTERLRISRIGTLILVVQALVVVSVLIFVVFSMRRRRGLREAPAWSPMGQPDSGPGVRAAGVRAAGDEAVGVIPEGPETAPSELAGPRAPGASAPGAAVASETEGAPGASAPAESGVIALSDLEELVDVEEIGEAEVEGRAVEVDGGYVLIEGEGVPEEEEPAEAEPVSEEATEAAEESAEEVEEVEEIGAVIDGLVGEAGEGGLEELEALVEAAKRPPPGVDALEELVEVKEAGAAEGAGDEGILDDLADVDRMSGGAAGTLPELGKLVEAGRRAGSEPGAETPDEGEGDEETVRTVPEELYLSNESEKKDDELSHLIHTIEDKGGARESKESLTALLRSSLKEAGFSNGALLVPVEGDRFVPSVSFGLTKKSREKLSFDGGERIYRQFLALGKTLYVREKVSRSKEVAKKFDRTDTGKFQGLVFCPLVESGELKGILVAGVSKGRKVDHEAVVNSIKGLKYKLVQLLQPYFT